LSLHFSLVHLASAALACIAEYVVEYPHLDMPAFTKLWHIWALLWGVAFSAFLVAYGKLLGTFYFSLSYEI